MTVAYWSVAVFSDRESTFYFGMNDALTRTLLEAIFFRCFLQPLGPATFAPDSRRWQQMPFARGGGGDKVWQIFAISTPPFGPDWCADI